MCLAKKGLCLPHRPLCIVGRLERGENQSARGKDGKEKIRSFCTELRRLTIHVEHDIAAMLWSDRTIS